MALGFLRGYLPYRRAQALEQIAQDQSRPENCFVILKGSVRIKRDRLTQKTGPLRFNFRKMMNRKMSKKNVLTSTECEGKLLISHYNSI